MTSEMALATVGISFCSSSVCHSCVIFIIWSVLIVSADEAHKGTGDYAYAQVVRYLMAKNPYFRLLALTATPGSTPEAVQAVVDSLHISHVEIRDEESMDLRPYMHEKRVEQHLISMNEDILENPTSCASCPGLASGSWKDGPSALTDTSGRDQRLVAYFS